MNFNSIVNAVLASTDVPFPDKFLAKSIKIGEKNAPGIDVFGHCVLVGCCAIYLAQRAGFTPKSFGYERWEPLALEIALHDIGKISPGFQYKIWRDLSEYNNMQPWNLSESLVSDYDQNHAYISDCAIKKLSMRSARIAGKHHGNAEQKVTVDGTHLRCGGPKWHQVREKEIIRLQRFFGVKSQELKAVTQYFRLDRFCENHLEVNEFRASGLCSIADWIASSYFDHALDLSEIMSGFDPNLTNQKIIDSLEYNGFISPKLKEGLTFGDIFQSKNGTAFPIKNSQKALAKFIREKSKKNHNIFVLEDIMGNGKTEAAMYAAYKLISDASNNLNGIYFALPTQATANQMLERMNRFLAKVVVDGDQQKTAKLIHSGCSLIQELDSDDVEIPGKHFYNNNTKSLLLPYGVGTMDQIIFASQHVKYALVKSFGLMRKVIIIDEVHSYDIYTSALIEMLITLATNNECVIIMLSATLSETALARFSRKSGKVNPFLRNQSAKTAFPRLTSMKICDNDEMVVNMQGVAFDGIRKKINVKYGVKKQDAFHDALDAYKRGAQVGWVDNVVADAVLSYEWFVTNGVDENDIIVLHSQTIADFRKSNEAEWCGILGKDGDRSRGRILVGTQLIEQSLDIDFDILFSMIAYSDNLLQRIGRLHRFSDLVRPVGFEQPTVVIMIPSPDFAAICNKYSTTKNQLVNKSITGNDYTTFRKMFTESIGKLQYVYGDFHWLIQTHKVWKRRKMVVLPDDLRKIIDDTYKTNLRGFAEDHKDRIDQKNNEKQELAGYTSVETAYKNTVSHNLTRWQTDSMKTRVLMLAEKPYNNTIKLYQYCAIIGSDTIDLDAVSKLPFKQKKKYIQAIEANTALIPRGIAPKNTLSDIKQLVDARLIYAGTNNASNHESEPMARLGVIKGNIVLDIHMQPLNRKCFFTRKKGYHLDSSLP